MEAAEPRWVRAVPDKPTWIGFGQRRFRIPFCLLPVDRGRGGLYHPGAEKPQASVRRRRSAHPVLCAHWKYNSGVNNQGICGIYWRTLAKVGKLSKFRIAEPRNWPFAETRIE